MRFAGVYLLEAHAVDEWPISEAPRAFKQHTSLNERLAAARALLADYEVAAPLREHFYADALGEPFDAAYASWPLRFWVLSRDRVIFKAMPRDASYDIGELESFLRLQLGPA